MKQWPYTRLWMAPIFLCLFLTGAVSVHAESGQGYSLISDQAQLPILTPSYAQRHTRKLVLDNGLQVYLVSDPRAEKSAAALCVKAGSWDDPDAYPGMAHFVEHLLFLGTKEFPEESAFDQFAHQHGGAFNAYTALDHTCYLFSIDTDAFSSALRRFASFFKEPLFSPSGVDRELHAIDQEFSQHTRKDSTRRWWVLQQLTNPKHPNSRFRIGNLQTLSGVPREQLLQWYEGHYSSNLMRLILFSPLDLDTLTNLVVNDFSGVPDRHLAASTGDEPLFGEKMKGYMSLADSLKDTRTVNLYWELPPRFIAMRDSKPGEVVSHILGHEGNNSLLANLKKEHLAESLSSGASDLGGRNYLFNIQIELTKKGLKNLNLVLDQIFQALNNIQRRGIPHYAFDELQQIYRLQYQYQEQDDAYNVVQKWAGLILDEDLATFPEQGLLLKTYDPDAVRDLVDLLTTDSLHIHLMAPQKQLDGQLNQKEPWGGTAFAVQPIATDWKQRWDHLEANSNIDIPAPNDLIPRNLQIHTKSRGRLSLSPHPTLLQKDAHGEAYYALDEYYQVPNVYWSMSIQSPLIDPGSPEQAVLAELYIKSVKEALNTYSYLARMAGLQFDLQLDDYRLVLVVSGYSENARRLWEHIITEMKRVEPNQAQLQDYKEALSKKYMNFAREAPLKQALEAAAAVIHDEYSTHKEKARIVKRITHAQFMNFSRKLFDQCYLQALLYGNNTKSEARGAYSWARRQLGGEAYPPKEQRHRAIANLDSQETPHFITVPSKMTGSAVILALQNGAFSLKHRAALQVLNQGMKADFFTTLRTQQQTGYAVGNWDQEIERQLFLFFAVESDTHAGRDLLARFELFLETFLRQLGREQLTQEQFSSIQDAFITQLEKMPENLRTMGALLAKLLYEYDANFDWIEQRLQAMRELEYEPFIAYTREMLGPNNKKRVAILFEGKMPEKDFLHYRRMRSARELRKKLHFEERTQPDNEK